MFRYSGIWSDVVHFQISMILWSLDMARLSTKANLWVLNQTVCTSDHLEKHSSRNKFGAIYVPNFNTLCV